MCLLLGMENVSQELGGYGQNGDKPKRRQAKRVTDCPDQNGDMNSVLNKV